MWPLKRSPLIVFLFVFRLVLPDETTHLVLASVLILPIEDEVVKKTKLFDSFQRTFFIKKPILNHNYDGFCGEQLRWPVAAAGFESQSRRHLDVGAIEADAGSGVGSEAENGVGRVGCGAGRRWPQSRELLLLSFYLLIETPRRIGLIVSYKAWVVGSIPALFKWFFLLGLNYHKYV